MLSKWRALVPKLTESVAAGDAKKTLRIMEEEGFGMGLLFQKEIMTAFCSSGVPSFKDFDASYLPFGKGARNGAEIFLHVSSHSLAHHPQYCSDTLVTDIKLDFCILFGSEFGA